MDPAGKVALVTGASRGIGLATAQKLCQAGAQVILSARNTQKLELCSKSLPSAVCIPADLSDADQCRLLIEDGMKRFNHIDIVVNNAGIGYDSPIEAIDFTIVQQLLAVDYLAPLRIMQLVIPFMKRQGGGAIVNVSSGTALQHLANMGAYASMKAALAHISLTAREELQSSGITVSVVYPYMTATEFETHTVTNGTLDAENKKPAGFVKLPPPDTADFVADLILDAVRSGRAETYAHPWMQSSR